MIPFDRLRSNLQSLWGDGRGWMLLAVSAGWLVVMGARMIYPVVIPYIRAAYGLDLALAGFLLTVLWIGFAFGNFPGGVLSDRIGARYVLLAALLLAAVSLSVIFASRSPFVLFGMTLIFGVSTGFYAVARLAALSELYPDKLGSAIGITFAAGDIGQALLPPAASFIAVAVAWEYGLGVAVPFFIVAAVLLLAATTGERAGSNHSGRRTVADPAGPTSFGIVQSLASVLARPEVLSLMVIMVLELSIWLVFTSFYPTYLIDVKGVRATTAGSLFGLFFVLGLVMKPIAGIAYDRYGARIPLLFMAVIGIIGFVLLPMVREFWMLLLVTVFLSPILGYGTITNSLLTDMLPRTELGTGLGFLRTLHTSVAAASPVAFGILAEGGFFDEGFIVLALLSALIVALTLRLPAG